MQHKQKSDFFYSRIKSKVIREFTFDLDVLKSMPLRENEEQ